MTAVEPLTIDDILNLKQVGSPELSPDGRSVAYVVSDAALEVGAPAPESRIWIVPVDGGAARQVTAGPGSDVQPCWSPGGATLAFRSDREARGNWQVYLLGADAGEARRLTDFGGGVSDYAWSPDGTWIAAVVRDAAPERAE
ncbi:MAG TPA: S9 family peptidase, partial [Nitrolancea sp.]